jgi:hypothetical protein
MEDRIRLANRVFDTPEALAKSGDFKAAAALIQKQLALDPKLLTAYGQSFEGMTSSLGDKIKALKEKAAGPVMEFVSRKLKEWLEWLDKNKAKAEEIAGKIGRGIVTAIQKAIDLVEWLADRWDAIVDTVELLATVYIGGRLVQGIGAAVGMAVKLRAALAAAAGAGASAGAGGTKGVIGKVGKVAKVAGWLGILYAVADEVADIGLGLTETGARAAKFQTMAERDAVVANMRAENAAAKDPGGGGSPLDTPFDAKSYIGKGGGTAHIKKAVIQHAEFREKDFARLSSPMTASLRMQQRASRPLAGLGLGASAAGAM